MNLLAAEKSSKTLAFLSTFTLHPLSFVSLRSVFQRQLMSDKSHHSDAVASFILSLKSANQAG